MAGLKEPRPQRTAQPLRIAGIEDHPDSGMGELFSEGALDLSMTVPQHQVDALQGGMKGRIQDPFQERASEQGKQLLGSSEAGRSSRGQNDPRCGFLVGSHGHGVILSDLGRGISLQME
jgi:hypothetical protein